MYTGQLGTVAMSVAITPATNRPSISVKSCRIQPIRKDSSDVYMIILAARFSAWCCPLKSMA